MGGALNGRPFDDATCCLYRFFNRLRFGGDNRRDHHDKADQRQSRYDVIAKVLMAAAFRARAVETMDGGRNRAEIPGDPADHLNCPVD